MDPRFLRRFVFFAFVFLIFFHANGNTQTVHLACVEDAIGFALKHNPDLQTYKLNIEKSIQDFEEVKYHRLPVINAFFSGQKNTNLPVTPLPGELFGHPGQTIDAQFGQKYNYNTGISISKNVFDARAHFTACIALIKTDIVKADEKTYRQKLAEQAALYYYTILVTKQALDVHQRDFTAVDSVFHLTRQKYKQGVADQYSFNLARINRNNVRLNILSDKQICDQYLLNFKRLLGIPQNREVDFEESISIEKNNIQPIQSIGPDAELEHYALQLKQSENLLWQQRSLILPKISVSTFLGWQQYREDFGISMDRDNWPKTSYWTLNITLPVFTGFSTKNRIESAKAGYHLAQVALNVEKEKSRIEDLILIKKYNNYIKELDIARENFLYARQNAELSDQKYKQGVISLGNYMNSYEDYLKFESGYLNTLSGYYSVYATILSRKSDEEK